MSDYIKRLEAALRAYERVVSTREVTGSTEADRRFSEGEIYLSAREAMFDELAELEPQDLRSLLSDVERLKDSNQGLEADLFEAVSVAYGRGATEWTRLNYPKWFERIEANEQARQALSAPNTEEGEASRELSQSTTGQTGPFPSDHQTRS